MDKSKEKKGKQGRSLSDTATRFALKPGDYDLGSPQSRAAARSLVEAKKKPRAAIQVVLVSPSGTRENGPVLEIPPE